jgi:hypothetical protein
MGAGADAGLGAAAADLDALVIAALRAAAALPTAASPGSLTGLRRFLAAAASACPGIAAATKGADLATGTLGPAAAAMAVDLAADSVDKRPLTGVGATGRLARRYRGLLHRPARPPLPHPAVVALQVAL